MMQYSDEDIKYLNSKKAKVKTIKPIELLPLDTGVIPADWPYKMRIEKRRERNEMCCIIDHTFNIEEYEAIIALYPGIRSKHKDKIASRFHQFYINSKIRGKTFSLKLSDYTKLISSPCVFCGGEADSIDRVEELSDLIYKLREQDQERRERMDKDYTDISKITLKEIEDELAKWNGDVPTGLFVNIKIAGSYQTWPIKALHQYLLAVEREIQKWKDGKGRE